eukprot:58881-Prorocentrum_minimum.AAC.1
MTVSGLNRKSGSSPATHHRSRISPLDVTHFGGYTRRMLHQNRSPAHLNRSPTHRQMIQNGFRTDLEQLARSATDDPEPTQKRSRTDIEPIQIRSRSDPDPIQKRTHEKMPPSRPSTAPMIPCKSTKSPPERGTTKSHVSSAYRNRSAIVPAEKIITT